MDDVLDKMTPYERGVYIYGASNFFYIIAGKTPMTLAQFADEIEEVYDKEEPHIKEVCRIFRKFSD